MNDSQTNDAPDTTGSLTKDEVIAILSQEYALDCTQSDPSLLMQVPDSAAFARFGRLILKMALGELDPARVPEPVMREVLDDIGIPIPADWAIRFQPRPPKTFIAMYPGADMALAAICRFRQPGGDYPMPPQYGDWLSGSSGMTEEQFYEFRVGDYTLSYCR